MISISIMISKYSIFLSNPDLLMSFMTLDDLKREKQQQKQLLKSFGFFLLIPRRNQNIVLFIQDASSV